MEFRTPQATQGSSHSPFGDYIVYVDESGDHGLATMDPTYPMFVLAFCIFKKSEYIFSITPAVQQFKFDHFGHDMVVLHEREIRKSIGPYSFLVDAARRAAFMQGLTTLIDQANFLVIATAIYKDRLAAKHAAKKNPYHIALTFGLERVAKHLRTRVPIGKRTHVVVERRGRREDDELELEFRRICSGGNYTGAQLALELVFASKQVNSCGLQLADLIARPIGRHLLDGSQKNRAFEVIERKLDRSPAGSVRGYGLKTYP